MKFWMNLYRQGWYHREGKPGTMPWHPGDVYPTREAAEADIDTSAPYLDTIEFGWRAAPNDAPYPTCSVPVPIRETRKRYLSTDQDNAEADAADERGRKAATSYGARAEAVYVAEVTDTNPPWREVGG